MTNPSYTDEQVREHAAWQVGETRKMMLQLLADRTRLQAEVEALRGACLAMIEWDEAETTHAVDFYKRMDLCRDAFDKARSALALSRATPNETKEDV